MLGSVTYVSDLGVGPLSFPAIISLLCSFYEFTF